MIHVILDTSDQQVSFTFTTDNQTFGVSAIYASTCYTHRRELWSDLTRIQNIHNIPWCWIGDFNAIIGAHEYRGSYSPARTPMNEFLNWSDRDNLVHLPTRGARFTWSNRRDGRRLAEKRLDRTLCNHGWTLHQGQVCMATKKTQMIIFLMKLILAWFSLFAFVDPLLLYLFFVVEIIVKLLVLCLDMYFLFNCSSSSSLFTFFFCLICHAAEFEHKSAVC